MNIKNVIVSLPTYGKEDLFMHERFRMNNGITFAVIYEAWDVNIQINSIFYSKLNSMEYDSYTLASFMKIWMCIVNQPSLPIGWRLLIIAVSKNHFFDNLDTQKRLQVSYLYFRSLSFKVVSVLNSLSAYPSIQQLPLTGRSKTSVSNILFKILNEQELLI